MNALSRSDLARLVANHLPKSGFVNLGIGAPTQIGDFLPADTEVMLHSENGILNVGPKPPEGQEDWDLVNAGKMPVTLASGGSYFDSSMSFAMMRGGHIDVAILGAFEVSESGDLANWSTGEGNGQPPGIGGAIDLAVGARQIWVMMDHTTKEGQPRIVKSCSLPLTAVGVVKRIFTNMAIIDVTPQGLVLEALLQGVSAEEVQRLTGAPLVPAAIVRTFAA
ncbi:3-oxoacid CoA-transferase subunit B [Comamonas sp.]|uniref:3-oxoacid CoA-transferase subunit B n=1 Tax=Comamonas sp. TaxID=34028 RepID=UPI002897FE57|nr:3-oxoacid CoA-transferase subunit B [Comamonas sp.]